MSLWGNAAYVDRGDRPQSLYPAHVGQVRLTAETHWYKRKPYIHFDVSLSEKSAVAYATDPQKVASHPFYPLFTYTLTTPRIKKLPEGSEHRFEKDCKRRTIAYPAHKDGYILSYYKSILEKFYEDWLQVNSLSESVTAFRSTGENNVSLARKAFDFIKETPNCRIFITDVESFFDTLDHQVLKGIWSRFLEVNQLPDHHYAVFKAVTRYSVVEKHKVYNLFRLRLSGRFIKGKERSRLCSPKQFREKVVGRGLVKKGPRVAEGKGIPQGTSLSPLLSNMYMADLDFEINRHVRSEGGKYWRYCDDILVVLPSPSTFDIEAAIDQQLAKLKLSRSGPKTASFQSRELSFQRQLQYLGFIFNGTDAMVRSSSIHRYHRRLKKSLIAAEKRRTRESLDRPADAPLRKAALYNMFTDMPTRGRRALQRERRRKYSGNFIKYMGTASEDMQSSRIKRQQGQLLSKFRERIKAMDTQESP
jgi:hypothetical protein